MSGEKYASPALSKPKVSWVRSARTAASRGSMVVGRDVGTEAGECAESVETALPEPVEEARPELVEGATAADLSAGFRSGSALLQLITRMPATADAIVRRRMCGFFIVRVPISFESL